MKRSLSFLLPPALVLVGVTATCLMLWQQTDNFRRGVEQIAEDVRVSLIDLDGKVVYDTEGQDLPNHSDRTEFEAVKADGRPRSIVRESETLHMAMFYHARRVGSYVLRVAVPYQAVTDVKNDATRSLLTAVGLGALIILALVLFGHRLSQRYARLAAERDIQRKLLAEMRKLEQFRRDFISNITHEIKTPVTGILGAVEVLADAQDTLDAQDRADLHRVVREQSVRLNALVEDILSLARLEQDEAKLTADFLSCDVADIVQTAVNLAQPTARKAQTEMTLTRRSVVRPCDPRLVESAVTNLLQNALRYSGSPTLEVVVEPGADGRAHITVTDHGIGIPAECLNRIFERFYRVDKNRSRALGGTGLGLAIVKHIAQLHGGEVTVTSRSGAGASFHLTI